MCTTCWSANPWGTRGSSPSVFVEEEGNLFRASRSLPWKAGSLGEDVPRRWRSCKSKARSKSVPAAGISSAKMKLGSFCIIVHKMHHHVQNLPGMQEGGGTQGHPELLRRTAVPSSLLSALPGVRQLCCLNEDPNSALFTRTTALTPSRAARPFKIPLYSYSPSRHYFSSISTFTA